MSQFNGCVPYAGVSMATRIDEAVLPVLFALLPVPQPVGITVAPPSAKVCLSHSRACHVHAWCCEAGSDSGGRHARAIKFVSNVRFHMPVQYARASYAHMLRHAC